MDKTPKTSLFRWKWMTLVAVLLVLGGFGFRWLNPAYVPPVQPVPNAYDELLDLAPSLSKRTGFWNEMADQELAATVAANEPTLTQARRLLRQDHAVSIDWSADKRWFSDVHMGRSQKFRELARAFAAEGKHAQSSGDTRRAVACGLEALRLTPVASYGGLGVDYLVGLGIQQGSLQWLRDACETATLEDCKYLLNNLPDVRKQMEPPAELSKREHQFMRQINGVYQTFVTDYLFNANRKEFEEQLTESLRKAQAATELLRLHYAIRAFNLVENRLPNSLSELAGRELKTVPADPFGNGEIVYVPGKDRYILYSVGPNGVDDGGVQNERNLSADDLFLEPSEPAMPVAN